MSPPSQENDQPTTGAPSGRRIEVLRPPSPLPYLDALEMQRARRIAVEDGRMSNALFLLEHEPVITIGRSSKREHVLRTPKELDEMGIALIEADRGGDVTYHGPGQLVAYPILDLRLWRRSIRWYLRSLEEILIRQLAGYGLDAGRQEGYTGVWVRGAKVAAIGVGIHNWVTFHGIALNVDPIMEHYACIVPCGIAGKPVSSLRALLGTAPPMPRVMDDFEREFLEYFGGSGAGGDHQQS